MIKKYYLTYGYPEKDKKKLVELISNTLGIEFFNNSRDSYAYRFGEIAETISIVNHYEDDDEYWPYPDFKDFPVLLNASITKGDRNLRLKKFNFLKDKLDSINGLREVQIVIID